MISVSAVRDPESTAQSRIVIDFPSTAMLSILGFKIISGHSLLLCWFYATYIFLEYEDWLRLQEAETV